MIAIKSYSLDVFQTHGFNINQLNNEIIASDSVDDFSGLSISENNLYIHGSSYDELVLDVVINNHQPNNTLIFVQKTVKESKEFADDLIQRFKEKNLLEGLSSIDQSAWVHHRLRKSAYILDDGITVIHIDVLNLVISGDIETAEFILEQMVPDNMTEDYHWLSRERLDWLRSEIRLYLGWPPL